MNASDMLILLYMAKGTQKEDQHSRGLAWCKKSAARLPYECL